MKTLLVLLMLTGCAPSRQQYVHVAPPTDCRTPRTAEADQQFDRVWGPKLRQSDAYKAAYARQLAGECDAIYDLVHPPGYRQSAEYKADMARRLKPYDDLIDDIAWMEHMRFYPGYYPYRR